MDIKETHWEWVDFNHKLNIVGLYNGIASYFMMRIVVCFTFFISGCLLSANVVSIEKLGIEQGLSSNYVVGISQDRQGYMWFATESGLNRFDGNQFRVFKKKHTNDHSSVNSNELNKVLADPNDDIIWIATQRTGLNAFDTKSETFTYYTGNQSDPTSIATNDITNLAIASDGNLWLSTYHFGVDYLDKKTKKFTHYNQSTIPNLVSNHVWCVNDDQNGKLYIGHVFHGLSVLSLKNHQIKNYRHQKDNPNSLPDDEVNCIFFDSANRIWIGTNNGLALFNPVTEKFTVYRNLSDNPNHLVSNHVFSICEKDNKLWIGTDQGGVSILDLHKIDTSNPNMTVFQNITFKDDNSGLSNSNIRGVFTDSFHNIWIITYGGGINFISNKPSFFSSVSYSPYKGEDKGLSHKIVSAVCFDGSNLLVGTGEGGLDLFQNSSIQRFNKSRQNLPDNNITGLFSDSKGNTWIGTANGYILHYNKQTRQIREILSVPTRNIGVFCFTEDPRGNIWIGTNKGLYQLNPATNAVKAYYNDNSELQDNVIRSVEIDPQGRLWVGSFGQGLSIFNLDFKRLRSFDTYHGFPSNAINDILRDSKNRMWIATREGLIRFNSCEDTVYTAYNITDGLADAFASALEEGTSDQIWISTNSGISRLMVNDGRIINYNFLDGIPMGNFIPGSAAKGNDGMIYFGSLNGLCFFNSHQSPPVLTPLKTTITDFIFFEKNISQSNSFTHIPVNGKTIELKHHQNTFSISFNVLDFGLSHQTEYAFMLKGLEDKWENVGNQKQVTFRNLPPENYEFLIKSRFRNQDWSKDVTSLSIQIMPPVWLTWWAKIIYILVTLWTMWFIHRIYKRKLDLENSLILEQKNHKQEQELNNERLSFYTNIAHELRTPLTLIIGPLEDLTKDNTLSSKHIKRISLIYTSALRLLNLINQILEFRKTETHNRKLCVVKRNLGDLVAEIGMKYDGLNQNPDLSFTTVIETKETHLFFDPEIVTIILDNLISNALKYTKKGQIDLKLSSSIKDHTKWTDIIVQDTGPGISNDDQSKIFNRYFRLKQNDEVTGSGIGLSLVKNLTELHEGMIQVISTPGQGSSFVFSIKTDHQYPEALHKDHINDNFHEKEEEKHGAQLMLIVEDNADIREYIADSFIEEFEILEAMNGQEGVDMALNRIPDIIVSDIMMPVMDGFELCKLLKADLRTVHIPIILLTAKDSLQDKTEGYNTGADSYITKPFSAGLLQSRVHNLLETRKRMAAVYSSSPLQKQALYQESSNKLDQEFINKVIGIIEDNLSSEQISIAFIADQLNMSNSTFYRKIKALTNQSPNEFIRKIKMHNAEKLLLTGKYTVSEIIFHVGINSSAYFRQCFKEEFGLTPTDYLKQLKEKK